MNNNIFNIHLTVFGANGSFKNIFHFDLKENLLVIKNTLISLTFLIALCC